MLKNYRKNKLGFTLLELLIVVIIIGVLAAIALPQYRKAVAKAELAQLLNVVKAISNAQERYFLANGTYASTLQGLDVEYNSSNGISCSIGEYSRYVRCYNKNFFLTHYFSQISGYNNYRECFSRNQKLASACKTLLGGNIHSTNDGPCDVIGGKPCYKVIKVSMPI